MNIEHFLSFDDAIDLIEHLQDYNSYNVKNSEELEIFKNGIKLALNALRAAREYEKYILQQENLKMIRNGLLFFHNDD